FFAMVVAPFDLDVAAGLGAHVEGDVGIRGHARAELGAEHLAPAVARADLVEDVERDGLAVHVAPKARFHRVLHEHAHLDDLALAHALRNLHATEQHQIDDSSRHAAEVTSTSKSAMRKRSPESAASTVTFCVPASRMRVEISARPDCGPRWNVATCGRGLRGAKTWIAPT